MKTSNLSIILLVFLLGCTSEPDIHNYTATLINESGSEFTVYFYDNETLLETATLSNLESKVCKYSSESFDELRKCDNNNRIDGITVIFPNGKGYSCDLSPVSEQLLCFGEFRNPLLGGFNNLGNNHYEFVITKEDFNNAHELPEGSD